MTDQMQNDKAAIRDLTDRYADAVTRRDFDFIEKSWTNEGKWVLNPPYDLDADGPAAILELLHGLLGGMEFFVQMPHAGVINVTEDRATARWTMHEVGRANDGSAGHQNIGFYDDVLRREDGKWQFVSRTYSWIYLDDAPLGGRLFTLPGAGG